MPDCTTAELNLKRGRNELLIKVGVHEPLPTYRGEVYNWSLFSRITDEAGEPLRELRYPLGG